MKAGIRKRLAATAAALSVSAAILVSAPGTGSAAAATPSLRAFGITGDGTLMATFTTDRPTSLDWVQQIMGLSGDTRLLDLDNRVQNGLLYGLGDKGGIYTIKTPPQVSNVTVTKVSQLQVPLYGSNFGFDFNPAADRLRVVSDNGQNLRHNLNDHTTVEDTTLTTPPSTGPTRGVTASGYTNNDLVAATGTLLYGIDTTKDTLVLQAPANNGTLSTVGSLGFDAQPNAGLDIFSYLSGGKTTSVAAFASLTPYGASTPTLYSVNLVTGEPTAIGRFPLNITSLAVTLTGS
ncbi:DUF4394 domain-containing protein [Streptomyces sp. UG1]|uniref:DUF4394 domain-containing protein n=1 Tax=Streptomyces sp. UG1 TaxID=3417652 RepID=UPI003CEE3F1A